MKNVKLVKLEQLKIQREKETKRDTQTRATKVKRLIRK